MVEFGLRHGFSSADVVQMIRFGIVVQLETLAGTLLELVEGLDTEDATRALAAVTRLEASG
jgi:hypothetical protein